MSSASKIPDTSPSFSVDVEAIRAEFPGLQQTVRGKPLVYLDNAATSQKPRVVLDTLHNYYADDCANVHRGAYHLSERSTQRFEDARDKVRAFINAASTEEIIFVRGATEGINLVASSYGRANLGEGDEVLVSALEHHSNIVPWQLACEAAGAILKVVPMSDRGELILDAYEELLGPRTRIVAVTHVSNALGTVVPIDQIAARAHDAGAVVVVDGAQAVPHMPVDVQALDADFYAFSGHKMYGPTGIGVLYGKKPLLEAMPPYQGGGEMIASVTFEKTTYAGLPHKLEAGTPHIAGAVGLGAAIDYIRSVGFDLIQARENDLLDYATRTLADVPGLRILGAADEKAAVATFVMEGVHPHDIATILDSEGIAIRAGHHCAQPVMQHFGVPATARASMALYNTHEEIDALVRGLMRVREVFGS